MLVLSRKLNQEIRIAENIVVRVIGKIGRASCRERVCT